MEITDEIAVGLTSQIREIVRETNEICPVQANVIRRTDSLSHAQCGVVICCLRETNPGPGKMPQAHTLGALARERAIRNGLGQPGRMQKACIAHTFFPAILMDPCEAALSRSGG